MFQFHCHSLKKSCFDAATSAFVTFYGHLHSDRTPFHIVKPFTFQFPSVTISIRFNAELRFGVHISFWLKVHVFEHIFTPGRFPLVAVGYKRYGWILKNHGEI